MSPVAPRWPPISSRMKTAAPTPSLTDEEFDRLSTLLDEAGPDAMNIEMLDGFFCALICAPDLVSPSEYLPEIWGEDFAFESEQQANELLGLLMRHWNAVADGLQRSLGGKEIYMPVLLEDDTGIARGNDWADGFMRGMRMRRESWAELANSEEHGGPLVVIMMLHYENDPDPELRPPPIPDDKREEIHLRLTAGVALIYRYFEPHRRRMASLMQPVQQRRVGPKIGRNDPCPCGSGKKYKQCCGAGSTPH